jgi:hypothetical protein
MEKIMWLVLGGIAFVAALRAGRSARALDVGRLSIGLLMTVFGAGVNAAYLATDPGHYAGFADDSPLGFVKDTWQSVAVPHETFYISVLIVCELAAGVMVMLGSPWSQAGLAALIGFHLGQLFFGWFMWAWAVPMLVTLLLLLRAERRATAPLTRLHLQVPRHGGHVPA